MRQFQFTSLFHSISIIPLVDSEGKAGMASIVDRSGDVDVDRLGVEVSTRLPLYARPMFLRLVDQIEDTGLCLHSFRYY